MAAQQDTPLFCNNIGKTNGSLQCCYSGNQSSPLCQSSFENSASTFTGGCPSGDCLQDCQNATNLYLSVLQKNPFETGNGKGPVRRYQTCANVPMMATYLLQNPTDSTAISQIQRYIPKNASSQALKNVTYTLTECLSSSCQNARRSDTCAEKCSGVNLIQNSTLPNLQGVNDCLYALCHGGFDSLPYADQDVVGIGVLSSYFAQSALVLLLWLVLTLFECAGRKRSATKSNRLGRRPKTQQYEDDDDDDDEKSESSIAEQKSTHQDNFESLIAQFHKAQCYFSVTLQIAALAYGVFDVDMLTNFLLIPLTTNSILPVVFIYILLIKCNKANAATTVLTIACWLLASLVYWISYSHIIPLNSEISNISRSNKAYAQFTWKLSAVEACGGYSVLSVCQELHTNPQVVARAANKIRVLTPLIWAFSTLCLLVTVGDGIRQRVTRKYKALAQSLSDTTATAAAAGGGENKHTARADGESTLSRLSRRSSRLNVTMYWLMVLCFLAGIGMQLALLSVSISLKMTDRKNWGFGQIVAITIWVPPILEFCYDEMDYFSEGSKEG